MNPISDTAIELVKDTVGKAVDGLIGKYLPPTMSETEKENVRLETQKLVVEELKLNTDLEKAFTVDRDSARQLAIKETDLAPAWTKVLTVTHRPIWSFITLALFTWTIIAPYLKFPQIPLTDIHKEIMQTVIIFYFGGRSIEKITDSVWGKN